MDDDGDKLGHLPSRPLLSSAYEETLNRLLATGAEVVVMVDIPQAPLNVSDCVSENLDSLSECAFPLEDAVNKTHFDIPAAEAVPEANSIEIQRVMCPDRVCRAVIGNVLVYRETDHVTGPSRKRSATTSRSACRSPVAKTTYALCMESTEVCDNRRCVARERRDLQARRRCMEPRRSDAWIDLFDPELEWFALMEVFRGHDSSL